MNTFSNCKLYYLKSLGEKKGNPLPSPGIHITQNRVYTRIFKSSMMPEIIS